MAFHDKDWDDDQEESDDQDLKMSFESIKESIRARFVDVQNSLEALKKDADEHGVDLNKVIDPILDEDLLRSFLGDSDEESRYWNSSGCSF